MNTLSKLFNIVFLLFTLISFSQETEMKLGFKTGVNFSSIASGQFNQAGIPRVGILVGVVGEFPIANQISFAPEVVYSTQGNVRRFDQMGSNFTNRTQINYINAPLLFKYYFNETFSIDLGPYVGANIISKSVIRGDGDRSSSDLEGVNTFDAGLSGSISYLLGNDYFISARYSRSFTSVFDNTADAFGLRARNSVFNISFGLYL